MAFDSQKKTARNGDSSRSLSSILSFTDSISSASSRLSSSISHSNTDSSFWRSPARIYKKHQNPMPNWNRTWASKLKITFKQEWIPISEIHKSWECLDWISLGQLNILNLHQMYAKNVAFIVDLLQPLEDFVTDVAVWLICMECFITQFFYEFWNDILKFRLSYKNIQRGTECPRRNSRAWPLL